MSETNWTPPYIYEGWEEDQQAKRIRVRPWGVPQEQEMYSTTQEAVGTSSLLALSNQSQLMNAYNAQLIAQSRGTFSQGLMAGILGCGAGMLLPRK